MSTYNLGLVNQRKNLPHIASNLTTLEPAPVMGGLFRFMNKAQANNVPANHRYHIIQPITTVAATAFNGNNYFIDFNLPMNVDLIDSMVLEVTLQNSHADTAWIASASVPFWFQRIEIRHDNEIKQTLRDLHLYLDNTLFRNDWERDKLQPLVAIDPESYKVDTSVATVAAASATGIFRLRLNSFITKSNVYMKSLKGQLVIRVYPQSIGTFSASAVNSSITCTNARLLVSEGELTGDAASKLNLITNKPVDYRYVDVIHEETTLSLTANSTTKYVTNNFHDQIYAAVVVLSRNSNPTQTNLETFLPQENIYLEDVAGMNLSSGIQWTDDELRKVVFADKFPNTMALQTDMYIYAPKVPSLNPREAYLNGVNNGYDVLPRNAKVCINPAQTQSTQVDILCYAYMHLRVENGKLNVY